MRIEKEFKASTVDNAIETGLSELGLSKEEVEIEVIKEDGVFSKAIVKISYEVSDDIPEETTQIEENANVEENAASEEAEEKEEVLTEEEIQESIAKAEEFLREFAALSGIECEFKNKVIDNEINIFLIGENVSKFIGWHGETLDAIQTLLNIYVNKGKEKYARIIIDAGHYREERKKILERKAKINARRAYELNRDVPLEPMNSYERKIIHTVLQNNPEVTTRSEGEGKDRHVIISPVAGEMKYGDSSSFRKNGPTKTKSFGGNKRRF
ncbi:MAG: KH domain-containing protein [Clostridia bacterium]|nr:KH domain-containing protein [Clostridia bacterium]